MSEKHPAKCCSAAKHLKHSKLIIVVKHPSKTNDLFSCINRGGSLSPLRILLIQVPLQKFPFLYSLFLDDKMTTKTILTA